MKPTRKANLIHQQILGALVANKPTTRTETRGSRNKSGQWVENEVKVSVPTLAGNVSTFNVELAARRWAK